MFVLLLLFFRFGKGQIAAAPVDFVKAFVCLFSRRGSVLATQYTAEDLMQGITFSGKILMY